MKRVLAVVMIVSLIFAPASFAATTLTDADLSNITAGDWVIIDPSTQGVADVYHTNNTLDLADDSQTYLQAVSNANVVDSAVAVQTNITSTSGNEPSQNIAVNGTNQANILNANPSNSNSEYEKESSVEKERIELGAGSSEREFLNYTESESESYSSDETLNVAAASAYVESSECNKDCEGETTAAAVLFVDYDKDVDYDKSESEESSESENLAIVSNEAEFFKAGFEKSVEKSEEEGEESRDNHGKNNHINLKDHSQQFLQAVSNLNAVSSGVAVQTNIASNVGVSGTITHTNIATVVNGF